MFFFFFNDTATTEIYTLSLHDALPIYDGWADALLAQGRAQADPLWRLPLWAPYRRMLHSDQADRKSTRLNSSHLVISYAVFCLKKKKAVPVSMSTLPVVAPRHLLYASP